MPDSRARRCLWTSFTIPAGLISLVGIVAVACAEGDSPPEGRTVRDSAAVRVVENAAPFWSEESGWRVAQEPELVLGDHLGEELFRVRGAIRLSDGRVVVGNGGSTELLVFDSMGDLVGRAGRRGDGPGEFRAFTSLSRLGEDSIAVFDWYQRRITFYDAALSLGKVLPLELPSGAIIEEVERLGEGWITTAFEGGRILNEQLEGFGIGRPRAPLFYLGPDGTVSDTLLHFPDRMITLSPTDDGGILSRSTDFGARSHLAVSGDTLVWVGDGALEEARAYGPDGSLRMIVRWPPSDRTLPPDIKDRLFEWLLERQGAANLAPEEVARGRRLIEERPFPEVHPAFEDLLVDPSGHLWVREFEGLPGDPPVHRWMVFTSEGSWLGSVDLPPGLELLEIGEDYVLGLAEDELEVERILVYGLTRE